MVRADSRFGRVVLAARPGRPLLRVTVSQWWARVLIAGGARSAPSRDTMAVAFPSDTEEPPGRPRPSATSARTHGEQASPGPAAPAFARDIAAVGPAAIMALGPRNIAAVLRRLEPRQAALILERMAAEDVSKTVALFREMTDAFAVELLSYTEPAVVATIMLELPAESAARMLAQIRQPSATEILSALPISKTMRLLRALPAVDNARLLNAIRAQDAAALIRSYSRVRAAAVLAEMNPRQAADVLNLAPSDPQEAAAVLQALPLERVGRVLDHMPPGRLATILKVDRAVAARLLRLMRNDTAREVTVRIQRGG